MSLPVMIFAAGHGRRMGALTSACPKPLLTVDGRALIDHALDQARAIGATRIVVNTHYLAEQIQSHLANQPDVVLLHESVLRDTGGGLKSARRVLGDGPVATLNADALFHGRPALAQLLAAWQPARMDALLLLAPSVQAVAAGPGDFFLDGATLPGALRRRATAPSAPFIHTGAQIINPARLDDVAGDVFSMNRLWDLIIAEQRAFGVPLDGAWRDVGTPAALAAAQGWGAG